MGFKSLLVINAKDKLLYGKRHSNRLDDVLRALDPFKDSLKGVMVESTFNWYWLVDGLQEHGYEVHLANPSAIHQYEGLKHTDDQWDAFWLAHMYGLDIEKKVKSQVQMRKEFLMLLTIPGIGNILGLIRRRRIGFKPPELIGICCTQITDSHRYVSC
jgi:hypothetical protein